MPGSTASTFPPSPEDLGGTGLTVVGHAHADLDSIASACVVARWLGGVAGRARVGDPYTDAIWESLGGEQLPIVLGAERVFLVDCQESAIEAGRVLGAIDHHAPFATDEEGFFLLAQVGAGATLISEVAGDLSDDERRYLAAAIISDTKGLRSSRTTDRDRQALASLMADWRTLERCALPGADRLSPEELRLSGQKKVGSVFWASAEGWGDLACQADVGRGTRGYFLFSWVNLGDGRTVTSLYRDGEEVSRHALSGIISRRDMGPFLRSLGLEDVAPVRSTTSRDGA